MPHDGAVPTMPSALACEVCGLHALEESSPHEYATGLGDHMLCNICGTHRAGVI